MTKKKSTSRQKGRRPNGQGTVWFSRGKWRIKYFIDTPQGRKRVERSAPSKEAAELLLMRTVAGWPAYHELEIPYDAGKPYIYFIQGISGGNIKIGSTKDIRHRFMNMQGNSPIVLRLLYIMPGDPKMERKLHKRFAQYRLWGEWFMPSDELLNFIKQLKASEQNGLSEGAGYSPDML